MDVGGYNISKDIGLVTVTNTELHNVHKIIVRLFALKLVSKKKVITKLHMERLS